MLTLTPETKAELLKNVDKTLMQAAVGHDLLCGVEMLLRELKTNQIWGKPLTTEQIISILEFQVKNYKESVDSVDSGVSD